MRIDEKTVSERLNEQCEADCPIRELLDKIGSAWSVLVVIQLGADKKRFAELRRSIAQMAKISQKMLTQTLRGLERDGLVKRTVYPTSPPAVEYELTTLGYSLLVPIETLSVWATENRAAVARSQVNYDALLAEKI